MGLIGHGQKESFSVFSEGEKKIIYVNEYYSGENWGLIENKRRFKVSDAGIT